LTSGSITLTAKDGVSNTIQNLIQNRVSKSLLWVGTRVMLIADRPDASSSETSCRRVPCSPQLAGRPAQRAAKDGRRVHCSRDVE
jgi:hypothetical protein